ncbi:MAG: cation diffusion facilitator family transporter [Anaerolineales bacterium]
MTSAVRPSFLDRQRIVRRGQWLTAATLAYNSLEAMISVGAGVLAGSVALVGFGIDSLIELGASAAGLWRLKADIDPESRARVERVSSRLIGASFLVLAAYVAYEGLGSLLRRQAPDESPVGIVLAATSLIVMPVLARLKRRVASRLASGALAAEARQTEICAYLSAILLAGLTLNALLGWWWADPVAGLVMTPLIAREGVEGIRGEEHGGHSDGLPGAPEA